MELWTLKFDGSCWPNPGGKACYGYILYLHNDVIMDGEGVVGDGPGMSNNVAEFAALTKGLGAVLRSYVPIKNLAVKGDSQLVINIMSGKWKGKSGLYYNYAQDAKRLVAELRKSGVNITFDWIPREENQDCDDLSKVQNPTSKK